MNANAPAVGLPNACVAVHRNMLAKPSIGNVNDFLGKMIANLGSGGCN
jgi:hypothetical protein